MKGVLNQLEVSVAGGRNRGLRQVGMRGKAGIGKYEGQTYVCRRRESAD
jgi:hypothetical protein